MEQIDLIVENANVITQDEQESRYENGWLAVRDGAIVGLGSMEDLPSGYEAGRIVDADGKLLLPGFISTHAHLFQTFSRGMGKDMPFVDWLTHSVRMTMPYMDEEAHYLAAMVGCLEAMQSGVTTILDYMYSNINPEHSVAVMRAFDEVGIRGILGRGICDQRLLPWGKPSVIYEPIDDFLVELDRLQALYKGHARIDVAIAPSSVWGMTREGLAAIGEYSRKHDLLVTMHLLENSLDDDFTMKEYGKRTLPFLEELGVLQSRFNVVHGVVLEADDLAMMKKYGMSLSYNPHSNMILGSGVAPVPEMLRLGIVVGLGTDGSASNDDQNMLSLMKSAALLQKAYHQDANKISAREVLLMATRHGADSIGYGDRIGSLEVGKQADFLLFDPMTPNMVPCPNCISGVVYNSHPGNINSVVINGQFVIENSAIQGVDVDDILRRTNQKAAELMKKAELGL